MRVERRVFERFTERARQVIVLAQEEARELGHNYIGTEHILLGLLREDDGLGAQALHAFGLTVEGTREQVVAKVGRGDGQSEGQIPFTPRAKKTLELSLREALDLGDNFIGTDHLLLGLLREPDGVAASVLTDSNIDAEGLRRKVLELISTAVSREEVPVRQDLPVRQVFGPGPARAMIDAGWIDGLVTVLDVLSSEIRSKLGRAPDRSDLLVVLTCAEEEQGRAGSQDILDAARQRLGIAR
jgi:ATP-dependent Clp protease ATP-binding subunit ClpA